MAKLSKLFTTLILILFGLSSIALILVIQTTKPTPAPQPQPNPLVVENGEIDTTNWKEYKSERFGFKFKYPEAIWQLEFDITEEYPYSPGSYLQPLLQFKRIDGSFGYLRLKKVDNQDYFNQFKTSVIKELIYNNVKILFNGDESLLEGRSFWAFILPNTNNDIYKLDMQYLENEVTREKSEQLFIAILSTFEFTK